jgi:hypothetical protein
LIFAIASGVGVIIPYASIAYYGGGLLGLGAGASVPLLELVGLGAHSAAIGDPWSNIYLKGLEKALKWKFIKAEDSQIENREMENLVTTIEEVAKKENVL